MIGTTVSHYKILAKLGGGGMGVVYRAEDLTLGREVALKFLPDALAEDPEALARFRLEARAASALNHPHICTIHELGENEGRPFIVMELMDGQTLKYRIGGRPMSEEQVVRLGAQVAEALEAAHGAGIVHRDLKPANVFVTERGDAKVLDFGLAKMTEDLARREAREEDETEAAPEALTTPGLAMGTVAYMSPEQVRGEPLDARTDLFSLGVVLYEMATGRQPFGGNTAGETFNRILSKAPTAPVRINPDLPDELERILDKALEKDKALRYQSAADLRADLLRLERQSTGAQTAVAASRPRRGLWMSLGAAALAATLAGALWLGRGSGGDAAAAPAPPAVGHASVAVLPFVDLSPQKDQEYFTDGLSEELLNVLAQIRDLKVAGRTSSFQFKDRTEDLRVIGGKLGVAAILEGSVRKAGDQVRITAQLVNVADGFHLWSQTYDRTLEDIFSVQDDIAGSVADALEVTLLGRGAGDAEAPASAEAYNLYLQGRYLRRSVGSPEAFGKSVEYFEQALAIDPNFAAAWAGLARARVNQAYEALVPFDEGFRLAREAADRAVALDDGLAEGWAVLGDIMSSHDWDWTGAELALGKARALAPSNADVLVTSATLSSSLGRLDQAIALARRAVELDPLSVWAQVRLGVQLMQGGHHEEAEATFRKVLELAPARTGVRMYIGRNDLLRSRPEAALEQIEQEVSTVWRDYGLALVYHALGRQPEAAAALAKLTDAYGDDAASQIAEIHAYWGEPDAAFSWLERGFARRDPGLADLKSSPLLTALHDDPRWPAFVAKMGLPE